MQKPMPCAAGKKWKQIRNDDSLTFLDGLFPAVGWAAGNRWQLAGAICSILPL